LRPYYRQRTPRGAPVSVFVAFKRDAYVVTDGQITSSISSPGRWRGFCARCGSTLTCEGERSNETHFHVGAFRDAAQLQPTRHIFQEERLPWLHLGACGYAASPAACRWLSPPSVEFARHTTGIIGIISGAVRAGCTCRGEVSQRGDALGPVASACLPQVRADKRLRAMLEGLFDRNHDHRRRLLAVDSKTLLQDRIDADPGPTVDPICFVRPGDQEDQCGAPPSRRDASDCSAAGDAGAAVARLRDRTSAPSAAPFRRRCQALVRPAAPRHRGSSG